MNQQQTLAWAAMSDRQRDAWVAREVFKYSPITEPGDPNWWQAPMWETPWGTIIMRDYPDGIPPFSTSLDAIWPAVEQIRKELMASQLQDKAIMERYQRFTRALAATPLYTLNSAQAARALCELLFDIYEIEVTGP